jgi:hypothetical protein
MRVRRLAIAGAALATVIGLSACGTPGGGDAPAAGGAASAAATTAPADAAAELAAAATALQDESMRVSMRMATGINSEGVVNADGSAMDMSMTMTGAAAGGENAGKIEMRKIADDLYMRFDAGKKWMHAAASDFPTGSTFASNPKDTSKMITVTTGVEKTGDRAFKGVLDMTKAPGADAKSFAALGAKATTVPFTAATDAEGRLTELVIDLEALAPGAGKMTATYTDFGLPVEVTAPPAGQVEQMPKDMLKMMGG